MSEKPVIVVVGSLHYDIMIDAPHRPGKGETVAGFSWRPKFGGKGGNQAVSAARAGVEVRMVGAVGDDGFGGFLLGTLEAHGIDVSRVARRSGIGSGMSVAIADAEGDYGAVIVSGANGRADPAVLDADKLWRGAHLLLLQNEMAETINLAAARAARSRSVMVCLNAAPYRALAPELIPLVDLLVVNSVEAEELCGIAVTDLASAATAAGKLATAHPLVVVTAGEHGVAGLEHGRKPMLAAALPVKLVSTHGAGDTFVGTLAAALARGRPFEASLHLANAAAAAHVSAAPDRPDK